MTSKKIFLIVILSFSILGCENFNQVNLTKFHIDKNIKYRLWYGNDAWEWIDIRYNNCIILEEKTKCDYQDDSPIVSIKPKEFLNDCIDIKKENSEWMLCNYSYPNLMTLSLEKKNKKNDK